MRMERESKLLQGAIAKGELFEYMVGEKGYEYVSRDADVPTEEQIVFASIVALYKQTMDPNIWHYFEVAWIDISASPDYSWMSLYYLSNYLNYSLKKDSYSLDLNKILPIIISNLKSNRTFLTQSQRWVGCNHKDGLWGDVKRMVANLNENHGLQIEL